MCRHTDELLTGAYWLTLGATLQPFYSSYGNYAPAGEPAAAGTTTPEFLNSFGYFWLSMGILDFVYMILALRTNVVFFLIFLTLVCAFGLLTGSYFQAALGNAALARTCQIGAGAFTFVTICLGWYLFFVIMLAALDFPIQLPGVYLRICDDDVY